MRDNDLNAIRHHIMAILVLLMLMFFTVGVADAVARPARDDRQVV
jgi:hypothetical protein